LARQISAPRQLQGLLGTQVPLQFSSPDLHWLEQELPMQRKLPGQSVAAPYPVPLELHVWIRSPEQVVAPGWQTRQLVDPVLQPSVPQSVTGWTSQRRSVQRPSTMSLPLQVRGEQVPALLLQLPVPHCSHSPEQAELQHLPATQ
jgi:hypothetical protein